MTESIELALTEADGTRSTCFLKVPDESLYGEGLAGDRLREVAWRLEGYPAVPAHSTCLAIARLPDHGPLRPAALPLDACCVVESPVAGEPYWRRLERLPDADRAQVIREAELICAHMVAVHRPVAGDPPRLYRRAIRDGLMNHVFRIIDGASAHWSARPLLQAEVERSFVEWRIRLAGHHARLRRTHNDFHPWNVLLDGERVQLIGARAPGFGDPANDVAAMLVNYLWFSYRKLGELAGNYRAGCEAFWQCYLRLTGDAECSQVFPPFLAMRLLVLLSPVYYPDNGLEVTSALERLLIGVLHQEIDVLSDLAESQ